jgi:hypothetical protein
VENRKQMLTRAKLLGEFQRILGTTRLRTAELGLCSMFGNERESRCFAPRAGGCNTEAAGIVQIDPGYNPTHVQRILSNTHYRRAFFTICGLAIALALLVRYTLLPIFDPSLSLNGTQLLASIIEKLLISFIVTIAIGSFIFWLEPEVARKANMNVVDPKEISMLLGAAIQETEKWWFRGGTGRYLRAVTLPKMAETTRSTSSTKELHAQLIDPMDLSICQEYAIYRSGLRSASGDSERWTQERVRKEIYATLLSLFLKAKEYPLLRIQITLLPSFSSFRLDLSSKYVILTKEDQQAPGVRCDHGSYFYNAYLDDLVLTARQGRSITAKPLTLELLSVEFIRQHFTELQLIHDGVDDDLLASVLETARAARNPYA